ncbi:Oxalate oxidoreductase subunit delta [Candidatus Brocadiaceae bacterium]|nr:Oxalate oxidoreductase subunit delta [Candidatus Brocadiaceae bacterium]
MEKQNEGSNISTVSLVRCQNYDNSNIEAAVKKALELIGGIESYVKPGDRVLLKINLLTGDVPEKAVTTHPAIVRAMIHQVKAAGGIPQVGDCSGYEGASNPKRYFAACRSSGIMQVCEEEEVELLHLSAESVDAKNASGRIFKSFILSKQVLHADVLISLPKLKTHGLTLFTGGVKNNFGCITGLNKAKIHLRAQDPETFSQMLVDLLGIVRPDLTVMDAVVGMEGNGPSNGSPKKVNAILASKDSVALDAVACKMVGIEPFMVPSTRLAHEQGIGIGDISHIDVLGEDLKDMRIENFKLPSGTASFFRARGLMRFLRSMLLAKPSLVRENCKKCWICIEHCPSGALSKKRDYPSFNHKKCIRCYCCQELCPSNAIELKTPFLGRFVK